MDDLEMRLEEVENRLATIDGAEPMTTEPGQKPVSLSQVKREVDRIWIEIRAIKEEISEIRAKVGV